LVVHPASLWEYSEVIDNFDIWKDDWSGFVVDRFIPSFCEMGTKT
jgi:hypothetical protein